MKNLLCLSFAQAFSGQMAHIPPQVGKVVKSHVLQQLSSESKNETFAFDDSKCLAQGTYIYSGDSLVLVANTENFMGRAEIPLTDALDGRKLYFPPLQQAQSNREAQNAALIQATNSAAAQSKVEKRRWLPWILAGAGVVVGGFMIAQQQRRRGEESGPAAPPPAPPPPPVPAAVPLPKPALVYEAPRKL